VRRLLLSSGIALLALPPAQAAATLSFKLPAPAAGSIVIVQVKGYASGRQPVRLKLLNRRMLGRTTVASATWRARRGTAYDGIVVLLRPQGSGGTQRATFSSNTAVSVRAQVLVSKLSPLLQATAANVRGIMRRNACSNNLRGLAARVSGYEARPISGVSASEFLRQACAAAMDETIAGAPQFWSRFGLPFCGFFVSPYGTAANEFQFRGSCNRALDELDVQPPEGLAADGCVRFPASDCAAQPDRVAFTFHQPPAPYAQLSGGRARVSRRASVSDGWFGQAQAPSGKPFGFRLDPTPGAPRFPF
jgi:hypothetical protein